MYKFILFVIVFCIYVYSSSREDYTYAPTTFKTGIGETKTSDVSFIRPIVPHPAVALRSHIQIRIANVPLTPLKSPLLLLPTIETPPKLLFNPNLLSPIKNQGVCGSCWAFSVCSMLSDRLVIQTGGLFNLNLSAQQLLTCFDREGCDGGSPEDACIWLADSRTLLLLDTSLPYRQADGGAVVGQCPSKSKVSKFKVGIVPQSVRSLTEFIEEDTYDPRILQRNIINMKRALIEGGPFFCAMTVYEDFFGFSGDGIYQRTKGSMLVGGHAIEIIGYCDKGYDKRFPHLGYWVCKNSWGDFPTQAKDTGYFLIEMGVNMCGIESRCGLATPQLYGKLPNKKPTPLNNLLLTEF
jgi:hypothetical protein